MSVSLPAVHFRAPQVLGLSPDVQALLGELVAVWAQKLPRNQLRTQYLEGKNAVRDLGISIPPALRDLDTVLGWPEKAVYGLAQRCIWDGVTVPSGVEDPFDLRSLLRDNRFDIELPSAVVSSLTHSVAFVSTTMGRTADGEPPVLIMMHSAMWTAGVWDRRRRALRGMLLINDVDNLGRPVEMTVLTPWETVRCVRGSSAWYVEDVRDNPLRRVPAEPLPYRPDLDRPFGRSRINRKVMSITDRAVRAALRMDVHGEFFSAAQFLLFGADDDAFLDDSGNPIPLWDWYVGRFKTLSRDENGELPELHEISQKSPEPHIAMLRQLAGEFAGETSISLSDLGIVQDNPASAEAMYAAKESLVIEATRANDVFAAGLNRVYQNAVQLRDGLDEVPDELRLVDTKWRNPALPSVVSASDAMVKQISAMPWLAETTVALEELGYTDERITRLLAEKRRAESRLTIRELMGGGSVAQMAAGAVVGSGVAADAAG